MPKKASGSQNVEIIISKINTNIKYTMRKMNIVEI